MSREQKLNNMALKFYKPVTPGLRSSSGIDYSGMTNKRPERKLVNILAKNSGRNSTGKVTTRHQGGREKRFLREVDWQRTKQDIKARVLALEYDPNRTANLALLQYADGAKSYI
jgi:large subunit ribosomal protein L2